MAVDGFAFTLGVGFGGCEWWRKGRFEYGAESGRVRKQTPLVDETEAIGSGEALAEEVLEGEDRCRLRTGDVEVEVGDGG